MTSIKRILFLSALLIIVSETCSSAEEKGDGSWEWTIIPYAWVPVLKGHITIGHEVPERDVGVDQVLDKIRPAAMLQLEGREGPYGLFLQPNYLRFENNQVIRGTNVDVTLNGWMVEFGGFYRLGEWGNHRPGILDLLVGGRYWSATTEVRADVPVPGVRLESTQGNNLIDPFVGIRVGAYLTRRLAFKIRGDIGGFGVNNTNFELKRSWQALGSLEYDFNRVVSLEMGYRALALNIRDKNLRVNNEMKFAAQGPVVGLSFRF